MPDATFPWTGWEGFLPSHVSCLSASECLIQLQPDPSYTPRCSGCQQASPLIHDVSVRRIRDRDLFEYRTWLEVPVRRLRCPRCGVRREALSWLSVYSRLTERLRQQAETLCRLLPLKQVASLTGLHWHTLKTIDKSRLERDLVPPDLSQVRLLMMDEFALFKGHRYASVAVDAETRQVLWVGEGRSRAAVRPFFEWLGPHCEHIEAVAMDMNSAMDLEVQEHCPSARVVYDLFHVIAKFGREVIDRVRVDRANELRHDKAARKRVKRSRWLLLRNPENLRDEQHNELDVLLELNQPLLVVYLMKAKLKELWFARNQRAARWRWTRWLNLARESGLKPLIHFANKLAPYAKGIAASADFPLNTSVLEGMNNRIKVIKRMAYGFRDNDYFFMKIKAAFPGNPR